MKLNALEHSAVGKSALGYFIYTLGYSYRLKLGAGIKRIRSDLANRIRHNYYLKSLITGKSTLTDSKNRQSLVGFGDSYLFTKTNVSADGKILAIRGFYKSKSGWQNFTRLKGDLRNGTACAGNVILRALVFGSGGAKETVICYGLIE